MGLLTVVLKLHKPSKIKQKIIDTALLNYNTAIRFLIENAYSRLSELKDMYKEKDGRYNTLALSKWIDRDMSMELNKFDVQPFKDSLKFEFGVAAESCLRFGAVFRNYADVEKEDLNSVSCSDQTGISKESFGKLRPIYFCRYDTKRSYCLLYNKEKDRFYAKLYLLNAPNARRIPGNSGIRERMVHIHKDNRVLERTGRREAFIIVPLAFGKWQEKILKEVAENPESFRTARLFEKKGEYYLAVSIESAETKNIKTTAYMGVSRGIKNGLNYTVVDNKGEILSQGPVNSSGKPFKPEGIPINELHKAANFIVGMSALYKAQVIVQNFPDRGDRLSWAENEEDRCRPEYKWGDYNRLVRLLDYKLSWKCLPKPVRVSPVGIFYTCMNCGLNSKKNRLNKEFFICTGCGTAMDIDKLGSFNLARKLIDYNSSKIKIKVSRVNDGVNFTNKILGLNCFSSCREDQLERLKNEIEAIIKSTVEADTSSGGNVPAGKLSVIKRLKNAENFMDMIEYV